MFKLLPHVLCYNWLCSQGIYPSEVKDNFEIKDDRLQFEVFEGGQYAYEEVEWNNNGRRWYKIIDSPALKPTTRVKHFMSVRNK